MHLLYICAVFNKVVGVEGGGGFKIPRFFIDMKSREREDFIFGLGIYLQKWFRVHISTSIPPLP
jgi:hypothetical protein